jgi:transposase
MLRPMEVPEVPAETARIAHAAFPKGALFIRLRDELGPLLLDQDFTQVYSGRGQPAVAPWRLTLITIMQFVENLSDRQAADAVRGHLAWKYALSLELDHPGFDASVLTEFRQRLLAQENPLLMLDRLLARCQELGVLRPHGKLRTDSTHVLAAIRVMNRLELIVETMRALLNALATAAPDWVQQIAPEAWYDRYAHRAENYRLPKSEAAKQGFADTIGQDGQDLLTLLLADDVPEAARQLPEIEVLRRCWKRQFIWDQGRQRFRQREELSKDDMLESPYDVDARYSTKRGREWTGYKVHLSETCDDDLPHLVTHVVTTQAHEQDAPIGKQIQERLYEKGLSPQEHWVDAGYNGAELIVSAREQHGTEIIGPVRPNTSWTQKVEGAFDLRAFDIRWAQHEVICPQRHVSQRWTPTTRKTGQSIIIVTFPEATCRACPVRSSCVRSETRPKSLTFQPQAQQEALHGARDAMNSEEAKVRYQRRAGIEATISQGVRAFGLRRSRYTGIEKTHLQHVLTALAVNVVRLVAWWDGEHSGGTRVSRFAQLRVA